MNLQRCVRCFAIATALAAIGLTAAPAGAQTVTQVPGPSGDYVFTESGPAYTALASLKFGPNGSVTGQEIQRAFNAVSTYVLQGTYTTDSGQNLMATLNATSLDSTDAEGEPLTFNESIRLIGPIGGAYAALRVGTPFAAGLILPAATSAPKGDFFFTGRPVGPTSVSVVVVNLDETGRLGGREVGDSFGTSFQTPLNGSYAKQPNGFQTLTISSESTDVNGNPVTNNETYVLLATQRDIRMIRIDQGGSGLFTLTQ